MEKKYQVFISSTFVDLEEARAEVLQALLKTDCFPAGMELFPAADEEQFEYIKGVIDQSDYYIVISAGCYGSTHPVTKLSYTEMEYNYAIQIGKPIIRLLHKNPLELLTGKFIENDDVGRENLLAFRKKMQTAKLVSFWTKPSELGQQVILSLLVIKRRRPTSGWVKGDNALTVELLKELDTLRKKSNAVKSRDKVEAFVSFENLKESTEVNILASEDDEPGKVLNIAKVALENRKIVEAVFLALLSTSELADVSGRAGDILSETFNFPSREPKYYHQWIGLGHEITEPFLHYLEARQLVKSRDRFSNIVFELTLRGKQQATFLSSAKKVK